MVEDDLWEEEMIRAGILSIALLMMSSGVVVAGECAKLCESDWWKIATQAEVAAEIATADLNARAEKGFTPLHIAAGHGTPEHITALLKVGGRRVDAHSEREGTPLYAAVSQSAVLSAFLVTIAGVNASQGMKPLSEIFANATLQYAPQRCAGLCQALMKWTGKDRMGEEAWEAMDAACEAPVLAATRDIH